MTRKAHANKPRDTLPLICHDHTEGNTRELVEFLMEKNCISRAPPICPKCNNPNTKLYYAPNSTLPPVWRCNIRVSGRNCGWKQTCLKHTIFEETWVNLDEWVKFIFMWSRMKPKANLRMYLRWLSASMAEKCATLRKLCCAKISDRMVGEACDLGHVLSKLLMKIDFCYAFNLKDESFPLFEVFRVAFESYAWVAYCYTNPVFFCFVTMF